MYIYLYIIEDILSSSYRGQWRVSATTPFDTQASARTSYPMASGDLPYFVNTSTNEVPRSELRSIRNSEAGIEQPCKRLHISLVLLDSGSWIP